MLKMKWGRQMVWGWLLLSCVLHAGTGKTKVLSSKAQTLVNQAFANLDPEQPVMDYHVHMVGNGKGSNGLEVNPAMLSPWHPFRRIEANTYIKASGVRNPNRFDEEYLERLMKRAKGFGRPVRFHILAMDHNYNPDGTINKAKTTFYVPNEYVLRIAREHPDWFVPVVSIHPARRDAIAELEKCAAAGARNLKWLPNAQGIDAADPKFDLFYKRMAELGMILLTHTGEEKALASKGAQAFGNPLRFRRALDAGVTVIMAHCASLGKNADLDHVGETTTNLELFIRMMDDPKYKGKLFGEISAMTQYNRFPGAFQILMRRPDLQGRMVNGSDYPLPAINFIIWMRKIRSAGMITRPEEKALREIYRVNPLLFDFVLKRTLRNPRTGLGLDPVLFQKRIAISSGS